jgi:hypothetical protein
VSTPMSSAASIGPDEDDEIVDQRERVQEHDRLSSIPHSDMTEHSIHHGAVRVL